MPRFYFEKLVRDKVLERCLEDPNVTVSYRILGGIAFKEALIPKIHEESNEVPIRNTPSAEVLDEISDLQTAVDALAQAYGYTREDIAEAQERKAAKDGGFEEKVYIDYVDLKDGSEWIEIFRRQPEKFREA